MEDLEQAIHSAAESLKSASGEREKLVASAEYNILLNELKDAIRVFFFSQNLISLSKFAGLMEVESEIIVH